MNKNERSLRGPWYTIKCTNTHIMGAPGGGGEEAEKIFEEITVKNFLN